jgi:segregation and condensation protein B
MSPPMQTSSDGADGSFVQAAMEIAPGDVPPRGPELMALIEALLLVAPEPPTPEELARGAGVSVAEVESALAALEGIAGRGWVIQRHRGSVQLATAPRFAAYVRRFLGLERQTRLSTAALETLAIIAYRQPVTKAEIEAVRGVDCAGVLATLHQRSLIETVGRLQSVGLPLQYGTTGEFLRHFGLRSLAELPPLGEVDGHDAANLLEATLAGVDASQQENGRASTRPEPLSGTEDSEYR